MPASASPASPSPGSASSASVAGVDTPATLVLGATGYIGSRLIPALLAAGRPVVAASSSTPRPDRYPWGRQVTWRRCDVTNRDDVRTALDGIGTVVYLVHSLDRPGFAAHDRLGARTLAAVGRETGLARLVYLSGLVPDGTGLSSHLASRLEVEEILGGAATSTLSLRAGVVIGAGSTSYEILRQLATLLLVHPTPSWLEHRVQPVAVSDVTRALATAITRHDPRGSLDVGGPDVLRYADLLAGVSRAVGVRRLRLPAPGVPVLAGAIAAASATTAPPWTTAALIQSLRHDLLCRPEAGWVFDAHHPPIGVAEAMSRAEGPEDVGVPEAPWPGDPDWTRRVRPPLPMPETARSMTALLRTRLGSARAMLRGD